MSVEIDRGWMVIRRQRRGPPLVNAAGIGDGAEVYFRREDAIGCRAAMMFPTDWDVIAVEVHVPSPGRAPCDPTT